MTSIINEIIAFDTQLNVRLEVTKVVLDADNSLFGDIPRDNEGKIPSSGITSFYRDQVEKSTQINGDEFCAMMVFQGEDFSSSTTGKAFKDEICDGRNNIGVVIHRRDRSGSLGRTRLLSTLAHEIGHIFGAEHDDSDTECEDQGFLMDGDRDKSKPNAFLFSECSLTSIRNSMSSEKVQQCLFA
jgi:hypothetical protein